MGEARCLVVARTPRSLLRHALPAVNVSTPASTMNPSLARTLSVISGSLRRPSLDVLDVSVVPMRVWPSDLDLNLHMNNGRYLTLMDLGRLDLLVRTGMWRLVLGRGWRPMVGSATVRFRRPLQALSRFDLHTRLVCWDDKWFFMEQRFVRGGLAYGIGLVKALLRGGSRNIAPVEVLEAMGSSLEPPPMPPEVEDWIAAEARLASGDRARRED